MSTATSRALTNPCLSQDCPVARNTALPRPSNSIPFRGAPKPPSLSERQRQVPTGSSSRSVALLWTESGAETLQPSSLQLYRMAASARSTFSPRRWTCANQSELGLVPAQWRILIAPECRTTMKNYSTIRFYYSRSTNPDLYATNKSMSETVRRSAPKEPLEPMT